jgi:hypothetical protein
VRAVRAERLATRRARTASTAPSLDLAMLLALPPSAARAASMASSGSDLPLRRRSARFGRLTSRTPMPAWVKNFESPAPHDRVPSTPTLATGPKDSSQPSKAW